jgi:hypothetical protein
MATLDTHGMVTKYKVDRPLNQHEVEYRFRVRQPVSQKPHYELSLIKLNSTFVESVDKWFAMRGWVAMGGAALAVLFTYATVLGASDFLSTFDFLAAAISLGELSLLSVGVYLLTRDAFTYTHYPIRFNRKNRQVYVFRRDGTVLKAAWDKIFWTIYGHGVGTRDIYVMGHLLDEHKQVKESFALSLDTSADAAGVQELRDHFEFFRRYMEDGPGAVLDAIKPTPLIMLPGIDTQRESWAFGWERLMLLMNGWPVAQVLFQVFFLPMSLFRWLVMRTSKIPQWPQWVEDECAIDPNDPWIRDGRHRAGAVRG